MRIVVLSLLLAVVVSTGLAAQEKEVLKVPGTLAGLPFSQVVKVGNTSLQVRVTVYLEQMFDERREKAIEGLFTFVAIDENMHPVPVRK